MLRDTEFTQYYILLADSCILVDGNKCKTQLCET